jgi:hypothetical protein
MLKLQNKIYFSKLFILTLTCFLSHCGFVYSPSCISRSVGHKASISFPLTSSGAPTRFSPRFIGVDTGSLSSGFNVPQSINSITIIQ